jgi:hypothetical protein
VKNCLTPVASDDDVIEGAGKFNPGLTRHEGNTKENLQISQYECLNIPLEISRG